jgi:hypothetical protein
VWPGEPGLCHQSADELTQSIEKAVDWDNDHTGSEGALQLASYWLQSCIGTHSKCRRTTPGNVKSFMPTRLLDVANNAIKLIDSKRYAVAVDRRCLALSHCWGPFPIIRTYRTTTSSTECASPPSNSPIRAVMLSRQHANWAFVTFGLTPCASYRTTATTGR